MTRATPTPMTRATPTPMTRATPTPTPAPAPATSKRVGRDSLEEALKSKSRYAASLTKLLCGLCNEVTRNQDDRFAAGRRGAGALAGLRL